MSGLILAVLVVVLVTLLASFGLSRVGAGNTDRAQAAARLATAAEALEAFAAGALRLPCPADPTIDAGLEVLPAVGAATCSFPEGTIPWRTIGLRRDDAFDPWGRKLSYRVYTGAAGSLTQPGGVSMVECDTVDPGTGNRTASAGGLGGLCVSNANPELRSTMPANFLAGKGLTLNDSGTARNDVAYVLVSHGATGLGGYTVSGARLPLPAGGDERTNTMAMGPFTIRAFSDSDTPATMGLHFDDILAYRTLPDLVKRIGLVARDWPEPVASPPMVSVTYDAPTVAAALNQPVSPGDTGNKDIDFGASRIYGFDIGGNANLSFDTIASTGGLGVVGHDFDFGGYYTIAANMITNYGDERVAIRLDSKARKFAVTLNDFGRYSLFGDTFTERVEFRFYDGGTLVGTATRSACNPDGGLASFSLEAPADFDVFEIRPLTSTGPYQWYTAFLVSAIAACDAAATSCKTSLSTASNECP